MCSSGDSEIQQTEQAQSAFTKQLMSTFSTQFANQQGILNFINGKMTSMVNNPTGFTPTTLAAMGTQNVEGAATSFENAEKASNEAEAAQGGNGLPSGVKAQITAQNANAGATQEAQGENEIALENAQQQQNNYWSALNVLNGTASQENPLGYASASTGSGEATANEGTAYKNSQSSQLLGALGGLAGGAGTALAGAKL